MPCLLSLDDIESASESTAILQEGSDSEKKTTSLWKSSRQQLLVLMALFSSNIFSFMSLAIMDPFFPKQARDKYMSETVSGWVFAIFSLVQFLFSPVIGFLIPHVGSRFLFLGGTFFAGGCTILFGFLDRVPATEDNNIVFSFLCFTLRVFLALGCTSCTTATFAIAAFTFPDNAATTMGILEAAIGIGLVLGPAIGGFLYEAGGFLIPFLTVGLCLMVPVPLYYCVLLENAAGGDEKPDLSRIPALFKVPVIILIMILLVVAAMVWISFDPILEPFLRRFSLSASQLGLVFLLLSGTYSILAPISGHVADKMNNSTPLIIVGYAILSIGFLLIGPTPLIGLEHYSELWLVLVSLVILGIGISLTVVPTYDKVLTAAQDSGFPDDLTTKSAVAGLWTSMNALGEFIGPMYAGASYEAVGFAWTMTFIAAGTIVMVIVSVLLYLYECNKLCINPEKAYPLGYSKEIEKDVVGSLT